MSGWRYDVDTEECEKCGEKLVIEVTDLGRGYLVGGYTFCWVCDDPVPVDWEAEHTAAEAAEGKLQ